MLCKGFLRRGRDSSPVLQPFCVFLCITTHFFVKERVDALYAIIIKGASQCISMQDLVLFSSWCNFFDPKMHCVQKPIWHLCPEGVSTFHRTYSKFCFPHLTVPASTTILNFFFFDMQFPAHFIVPIRCISTPSREVILLF